MWMDSKSFSIFCPEHNEYVEYVCLMNSCYQKLLCNQCMKKHKSIHKNEQVQLCELINELRGFQCGKLLEGEDLAGYHDQVRSGHRILRDNEGKPSDWVTVSVMRSVNGKDQEIKRRLFEEKAIQKKNKLINNQVETLSNTIRTFVSSMERKILLLQRRLSESVDKQLTKATSRSVLEVKFIKDACIQKILEALKNNTDRYNQLSRSLQQFHKGYLELDISKNIFKEITQDIAIRMKQFNHNLAVFFDGEVERQFGFILDDSDLSEISSNNEGNNTNSHGNNNSNNNNSISSSQQNKSVQEMIRHRPEDEKQMQKMIDQLKEISRETQEKTEKIEDVGVYTNSYAGEDLMNTNNLLDHIDFQNYPNSTNNTEMSNLQSLQSTQKQQQQGYSQIQLLQYSNPLLFQHSQPAINQAQYYLRAPSAGLRTHNNTSAFLNTPTKNIQISPAPSSSQSLNLPNNINNDTLLPSNEAIPVTKSPMQIQPISKVRRAEIARSLDYQKKEIKIDLKGIEKEKYSAAQKQLRTMLGSQVKGKINKDITIDVDGNGSKAGDNQPDSPMNYQLHHSVSLPFQQKTPSNFRISHKNTMSTTSTSMFNPNTSNNASNQNGKSNKSQNNNFSDLTESSNFAGQMIPPGIQLSKEQVNSIGIIPLTSNPSRQISRTSLLASLTNPNLRTYSSLSSLQMPNNNMFRNSPLPEQAKALNRSTSDALLSDTIQQLKQQPAVIATHSEHSCLFDYQGGNAQEKSVVIGMLSVMMNRYILFHENGIAQVWECQKNELYVDNNNSNTNNIVKNSIAGGAGTLDKKNNNNNITTKAISTPSSIPTTGTTSVSTPTENEQNLNQQSSQNLIGQLKKWKELNFNKRITCITEMNDTDSQVDPLMFTVACQNYDQSEFAVYLMKYECRKNRFFQIDCMKFSTAISSISCTFDKQFKRKNLPSSLQLVTDVYYFFTLHPFDDGIPSNESTNSTPMSKTTMNANNKSINSQNNSTPILRMLRVQLHRDKHGSVESEILSTIKIDQGILISRIIYDPINECLWGHSDYYLFKWTINYLTGVIEKANCLQLCKTSSDVITSMLLNTKMLIVSSLSGNLWGIDVMMNKVFEKDCQRFKYSQINSYNAKIQGKDQIQILSGSLLQIQRHNRYVNIDSMSNNKSSGIERYFLYSTLSAAGPKLFCFKPEFREVAGIIPGQNSHVQLAVATELDEENDLIVAVEDFRYVRVYEKGIPKMEMQ